MTQCSTKFIIITTIGSLTLAAWFLLVFLLAQFMKMQGMAKVISLIGGIIIAQIGFFLDE